MDGQDYQIKPKVRSSSGEIMPSSIFSFQLMCDNQIVSVNLIEDTIYIPSTMFYGRGYVYIRAKYSEPNNNYPDRTFDVWSKWYQTVIIIGIQDWIKLGDGTSTNLESLGLYIVDAEKRVCAPIMPYEKQYFPELGKEFVHEQTYDAPFEYKLTIGAKGTINHTISSFFQSCKGKRIEIYIYFLRLKIVGYVKSIDPSKRFFRSSETEIAEFDMVIDVNDPSKCNFNL